MDLQKIENPDFIKDLSNEELVGLAENIREFLIDSLAETGGHLGPNLGVVELTIALYNRYNFPEDKLIFDIGHQAYVHKILTGRAKDFPSLRKIGGLSGFLKRSESEYDIWEAGHSSTSISAAAGFAKVAQLEGKDLNVIALIGDGSLTNGMALEALNQIVEEELNVTIVINDNEMSISKNIGFINNVLGSLSSQKKYYTAKTKVRNVAEKNRVTKEMYGLASGMKNKFKNELQSANTFFSTMGYDYIGAIDGHDFTELFKAIDDAKKVKGPKIIHVKTIKGKGYKFAEDDQWHAIGPFDKETGKALQQNDNFSYSEVIAGEVAKIMRRDKKVVAITPAMLDGSKLQNLKKEFNDRVVDVGIAEEHAAALSASIALAGYRPFLAIYSTFLQRAYDQVFHDIDRQKANVVIGIDRAGLVGEDGETHQGIYDISFLSHMPNSTIIQGKDDVETRSLLNLAFTLMGPTYIRYPKGGTFTDLNIPISEIEPFTWEYLIKEKGNMTIISYGENLKIASAAAQKLPGVSVINARFIKPFDEKMLKTLNHQKIYILEEHAQRGGLGTILLEYINENNINIEVIMHNLGNQYIEQGKVSELYNDLNFTANQIIENINNINTKEENA